MWVPVSTIKISKVHPTVLNYSSRLGLVKSKFSLQKNILIKLMRGSLLCCICVRLLKIRQIYHYAPQGEIVIFFTSQIVILIWSYCLQHTFIFDSISDLFICQVKYFFLINIIVSYEANPSQFLFIMVETFGTKTTPGIL